MDEIDKICSYSGSKYDIYKIFDTFWFINIDGDQNRGQKGTPLKTRYFLSLMVHLIEFAHEIITFKKKLMETILVVYLKSK
jgi:hypothetical protein